MIFTIDDYSISEKVKGIAAALTFFGHKVRIKQEKSVHDCFSELKPDAHIYQHLTSPAEIAAAERYGVKLVNLKLEEPASKSIHLFQTDFAANILQYFSRDVNHKMATDILIPSCPLLTMGNSALSIVEGLPYTSKKIVGQTEVFSPYYLGAVTDKQMALFFSSAYSVLDFHGQWAFDGIMAGCRVFQYGPQRADGLFDSFTSVEELNEKLSTKEDEDKSWEQYVKVRSQTYLHKTIDMFNELNYSTDNMKDSVEALFDKYNI